MATLLFFFGFILSFIFPFVFGFGYIAFGGAACVLIVFLCLYFFVKSYEYSVVSFFLLFSLMWVAFSNLFIEFGSYIPEQARYGAANGATAAWALMAFLLASSGLLTFNLLGKMNFFFPVVKVSPRLIVIGFFLVVISFFCILVFFGSPLLAGVERFEFWLLVPAIFGQINNYLPFLLLILGAIFGCAEGAGFRYFIVLIMIFLLVVYVFLGAKFTSLFVVLAHFFIGKYLAEHSAYGDRVSIKKAFWLLFLGVVVLLPIVSINYMVVYGYSWGEVVSRILDRALALQGHVWYGVYDLYLNNRINLGSDILFDRMVSENNPTGIVALMWEIAPSSLVEYMRSTKVSFTMGAPANFLSVYGLWGAVLSSVIGGFLWGGISRIICYSINSKNYLLLLIMVVIYRVFIQAFMMGDFFKVYDPVAISAVFGGVWIVLISLSGRESKKNAMPV